MSGKCTLYTRPDEYGWAYLLLSAPALFFYNEAVSYYPHRMFHIPFLYRHVHKVHHRYGSPTLYTATVMHTLEFLVYQTLLMLPVFVVPLHAGEFFPVFLNASELSSVSLHVCKFLYVPLSVWKMVFCTVTLK